MRLAGKRSRGAGACAEAERGGEGYGEEWGADALFCGLAFAELEGEVRVEEERGERDLRKGLFVPALLTVESCARVADAAAAAAAAVAVAA